MSKPLVIAAAKGYLLSEALEKFSALGIHFKDDLRTSRKLSTEDTTGQLVLLQVRPWDVPTYVENGAADLGIAGLDVLEEKPEPVLRLIDLQYGACKLVLAGPSGTDALSRHNIRVATKYPTITSAYFNKRGIKAQLIKLYGSIELAPVTGLADIISDLTATGTTLRENHLDILETLLVSSAHLITNTGSLRWRYAEIAALTARLSQC
jgi:ATP phosphoribosyltransferase